MSIVATEPQLAQLATILGALVLVAVASELKSRFGGWITFGFLVVVFVAGCVSLLLRLVF